MGSTKGTIMSSGNAAQKTEKKSSELTTAQPSKALAPIENLKSLLAKPAIRSRFEEVLGKRSAAFTSSIISAVSANKDLAACEPMSVISSAAVAAAMDLPISPGLGMAHIVPYNQKNSDVKVAQFQIGWKGFVQLAMRTGQYKTINLTSVLEGQLKKHDPFTGEMEFQAEASSDKQIGYLLYFKLLNGYEKYFYMSHAQCLAHGKRYSKAFKKGFGLWVENFEAMALKTVCKLGLSKYGVLSVEMQKAIEMDQAAINEDGSPSYIDNSDAAKDVTPESEQAASTMEDLNRQIEESI